MAAEDYPTVTYRSGNRIWWVVAGLAVLVAVGAALILRFLFAQLPPGTTLAGEPVSTPSEAVQLSQQISSRLLGLPVELTTAAGSTTVSAGRLGATLDTEVLRTAAVEGTGADAWWARYTGRGPQALPVQVGVAGTDLREIVEGVSREPVDGDLAITATGVEVTDPVVGVDVTAEAVRDAVTPALQALATTPLAEWPDPLRVEVDATEIEPVVGQAAVDAAVEQVERMTAEGIELTASVANEDGQTVEEVGIPARVEQSITLGGDDLRALLATEVDPGAIQRQRLRIVAAVDDPPPALLAFLDDADVVPEMRIRVENRSPTPERGGEGTPNGGPADQPRLADVSGITGDLVADVVTPGLEVDVEATIRDIVRAAEAGEATAAVAGTPVTDADPALLGIVQPVGTYTTFFNPGEGRNTNIRRIAEILDGSLIPPEGNFEVNHAAGRRTVERGFVEGGAILDGEFVTDVGGGVSQFATTFFNAMWFTGVDIITHTPHSFFIDRYPAGREATINYPGVNLELNNNSPYWILVDTATTDDSVTVTFWSTPHFEVTQSIGPRQPVSGANFRIQIERRSEGRAVPELDHEATVDTDAFTHTYRAQ